MHPLPTAGGGGPEAATGAGGGEAGAAAEEGGVPERPGEAERRSEEAGEGQGRRAEAVRQYGGGPCGRGEQTHHCCGAFTVVGEGVCLPKGTFSPQKLNPGTGNLLRNCAGFNHRNKYCNVVFG